MIFYISGGDNIMDDKIEIRNVSKKYGSKTALENIDLTIGKGMFGLLGRNGAGKTTLMKTLAALHPKNSGTITVCGVPIEETKKIRTMTGYLPQDFSMYPTMRVEECLDYLGVLSGMDKALRKERADMLLKKVNLEKHRRKKVKELSGGMKRRLGIAQALLHDPRVLIVDEPTAGLDPEERIRFRNLLGEVAEDRIVILSTHIVGDIEASCEMAAVMNEGRILWTGNVKDLLKDAEGKVWTVTIESRFLPQIKSLYSVTGMVMQGSQTTVRFVHEGTPDVTGAAQTAPCLEDAYIYCLFKNGCIDLGGEK